MPNMQEEVAVFWFRRDLRLNDNAGLYHALKSGYAVLPVFLFDTEILSKLAQRNDARVTFIHRALTLLSTEIAKFGGALQVFYGTANQMWDSLLQHYRVKEAYTNRDYEPYALQRDKAIYDKLAALNIPFKGYKDQCIFDKNEVMKDDGTPYTVFTPYSKKWKLKLSEFYTRSYPNGKYGNNFLKSEQKGMPSLSDLGFTVSDLSFPHTEVSDDLIAMYAKRRDTPSLQGTSRLSVHLRFGTLSIREQARRALKLSETWLNELIWRDFYMMILYHFPHVATGAFRKEYDRIAWLNDEANYQAWCMGRTGYPLVDAGMRELNATGFMHNRVRMVTASFLTKHLLIDYKWGESYFAEKLLDFDLSANNGGWQWAAGCGCDAAPYFRVFNPELQMNKFDPELKYVKKWVPEYGTGQYPQPIVNHAMARVRAIEAYKRALQR